MRAATNLLLICIVTLFLFGACAGLGLGVKAVTSNGNHTEINVFSNNNLMSNNSRTDTRTSNIKIDNDNTAGVLMLAGVVVVAGWVIGRAIKVGP